MSVTDAIVATFAATVTLIVLVWYAVRVVRICRRYAKRLLAAVEANVAATGRASAVVELVRGELTYMRQITQGVIPQQQQETQPPIGRVGRMPPAFPQRDWAAYAPDAKPEDTDHSLLTETDEDVMAAQLREEAHAQGIELDEDDVPQAAVVEDA
jgi:hypothetical protein